MRFILLCLFACLAADDNSYINQVLKRHDVFREGYFKQNEQDFVNLVKNGQSPKILFIGCSDSRVVPELITQSKPGDIFVIRNAGNFVTKFDPKIAWDGISATIQYAVEALQVKDIIVCGHSHCGAIDGVIDPKKVQSLELVYKWIQKGEEAGTVYRDLIAKGEKIDNPNGFVGRLSVLLQLEHLLSYPWLKEQVDKGAIRLHAWYFIIEEGKLEAWEQDSAESGFETLSYSSKP